MPGIYVKQNTMEDTETANAYKLKKFGVNQIDTFCHK